MQPSLEDLAHLRRARDFIDREYAKPLDVPAMATTALMSPSHFARQYKLAFGEGPYRHLLTRRIERAKALLRAGELSVTRVGLEVGFQSLGAFSGRFAEVVGMSPKAYRASVAEVQGVPPCYAKAMTRPPRFPAAAHRTSGHTY